MSVKRIPIRKLRLGMYVAGLDRSWLSSPFLRHRFLLDSDRQLERLRRHGVKQVLIDTARGLDEDPEESELWKPSPQAPAHHIPHPAAPPVKPPRLLARDLVSANRARHELMQSVQSVFDTIGPSGTVSNEKVSNAVRDITTVTQTLNNPAAFLALSRARDFDPALNHHAMAVCTLALILGRAMEYDRTVLEHLATGALLHDIGLIRMPHHFLRLSQTLGKHERTLYESHPRLAAISLEQSGGFHHEVLRIVAEHHVTPDGKGFPSETAPDGTSECSRLILVVDRYEELVSGHGDLSALPAHQALGKLYQEAQQGRLDQTLVARFIGLVGVFPVYSPVRLNTGERGIVTGLNPEALHQPLVMLYRDSEGRDYSPPQIIDLQHQEGPGVKRTVAAALDPESEGINIAAWLEAAHPDSAPASASSPAAG